MSSDAENQLGLLLEAVYSFSTSHGAKVVASVDEKSSLFLEWIPYLNSQKTGVADELLDGAVSSLREAAACAGLGLVRPALLALRTEIDLVLGWIYFKDHRVEWEYLNVSGDGFKLKKEILDYLSKHVAGYGARNGILKEVKKRLEVDPYRLLSAHVHSQSLYTLPLVAELKDVVGTSETLEELPMLAFEVDEYVSDILFSIYAPSWTQIAQTLRSKLDLRFKTPAQKNTFYSC
ncbi:hypothetical protein [Pseudomonas sp. EA_35y_Pfl2_R111]|uniref:hypothetical protein n=1 Tax=Pseudomonas sp. EA_35y_Pfl2_R111 TaxID=3088689 RepID=UPI0030DAFA4C